MRLRLPVLGLLAVLALDWASAEVSPPRKSEPPKGDLFIEPSSTAIPGGKASLSIGVLTRHAETYRGDYQFKVSPYFFKSENGKLSVDVSSTLLRKLAEGMTVDFTGEATTSESGETRRIEGKATPFDQKQGAVSLRIIVGSRKMLFNTSYRFDEPRERPR